MPTCWHCRAELTHEHAQRIAENKFSLHWEDWDGWRFSGRFLIAPGRAGRILPQRILGMLWEERQRTHAAKPRGIQRPTVARLPARERFDGFA